MAKRSFVLFHDYREQICSLSDAACGQLFKAIFAYEIDGESPKLPQKAEMAFMFIKHALDENREKYKKVCAKRSEAGIKSGEARRKQMLNKTNMCSNLQTKRTDTETVTETETDTVTVTETETVTETDACIKAFAGKKQKELSPTPSKTAHGEFDNVFLSDEEYGKLEKAYGTDTAKEAIEFLSTRIARDNRYKNENHYATIKDWVITALQEQKMKNIELEMKKSKNDITSNPRYASFDFDLDDICEKP